ncbi:hypothetical protein DL767_001786 [Monosporascus sp. MG133]|nr:hypothetical protein DL767_001786 [Monosporascus sp. MG133]
MKVYKPQCSLPANIHGYVSSPETRGTLDIVWACVATLLLCTWTVLHLNVPIEVSSKGTAQIFCYQVYLVARKLQWMLITLIAPEVILGMALMDLFSARCTTREMLEYAREDGVPWTLTHSFLANMGGYAIEFGDEEAPAETKRCAGSDEVGLLSSSKEPVVVKVVSPKKGPEPIVSAYDETTPNSDKAIGAVAPTTALPPSPTAPPHRPSSAQLQPGTSEGLKVSQTTIKQEEEKQTVKTTTKKDGQDEDTRVMHEFWRRRMANSRYKDGVNLWEGWPMGEPRWQLHKRNELVAEKAVWASRSSDVGLQKHTTYWYNIRALSGNVWILDARQLLAARRRGIIAELPHMTEDEINDRSKSDAFVKVLAAGQVLWLIIQLVFRAAQGLTVTQLEIVTLAFALCSLATYMALLSKPKDLSTRVYMPAARPPLVDDMKELGYLGPTTFWYLRATTWMPNNSVHYLDVENIRWLRFLSRHSPLQVSVMVTVLLSVPFGAVHLIAWNSEFPTQAERLGWHISCLLTIIVPFFIMAAMMYAADVERKLLRLSLARVKVVVAYQIGFLMAIQTIGRLFVFVEAFRSLISLPTSAFITTEMGNVPHLQ